MHTYAQRRVYIYIYIYILYIYIFIHGYILYMLSRALHCIHPQRFCTFFMRAFRWGSGLSNFRVSGEEFRALDFGVLIEAQ